VFAVLLARNLIWVRRNDKGYVVRAECRHLERLPGVARDECTLLAVEPSKNARYSFRNAEFVTRPRDLKRLNGARTGVRYAPAGVIPDFTMVVSGCLHTQDVSCLSNLRLLARIAHNCRMPEGNLALLLPASNNSHQPQVLTRVDHAPTAHYVAGYASDQARRRADAESCELARVLGCLLKPCLP
jgi:hypothetical protein